MEAILSKIANTESIPRLRRDVCRFFNNFGFKGFSYYLLQVGINAPAMMPVQNGYSRRAREVYLSQDYQRLDIVPRVVLARGVPMLWSEVWATSEVTAEEQAFLETLRAVPIGDGLALPCYGPRGRNAHVGLGRMSENVVLIPSLVRKLHFVAQAAHLRVCEMFDHPYYGRRPLSTRERQILEWVARGKSNSVIAEILTLAPGTVDTYLRRIYEKLDVADRTSAAVKGVGMGLIAA